MKKYIELLFSSRLQSHVYHLQTKSYAKHIALNEYYEEIVCLIDSLVETYQGKYDIIDFDFTTKINGLQSDEDIISYFERLLKYTQTERKNLPQDDMLTAKYDDIDELVSTTLYKLKHLS